MKKHKEIMIAYLDAEKTAEEHDIERLMKLKDNEDAVLFTLEEFQNAFNYEYISDMGWINIVEVEV